MSKYREMMYTINARWYLDHWDDGYEKDYEEEDYDEWDYIGGEEYEYAEEEDYGDEYEEEGYATGFITGEYNIFIASQIIASQKLIDGMQGESADYWLTPIRMEDPSPWMK